MSDPRHTEHPPAPDVLTGPDHSAGVEMEKPSAGLRSQISNAMVGLKKQYYGKGPEKAKTFINDNYVFCVLEGGLTRNEETLLAAGQPELVRTYRLQFQAAMEQTTIEALEQITGRRVLAFHSQIVFDPDRSFEIFVLDAPLNAT